MIYLCSEQLNTYIYDYFLHDDSIYEVIDTMVYKTHILGEYIGRENITTPVCKNKQFIKLSYKYPIDGNFIISNVILNKLINEL